MKKLLVIVCVLLVSASVVGVLAGVTKGFKNNEIFDPIVKLFKKDKVDSDYPEGILSAPIKEFDSYEIDEESYIFISKEESLIGKIERDQQFEFQFKVNDELHKIQATMVEDHSMSGFMADESDYYTFGDNDEKILGFGFFSVIEPDNFDDFKGLANRFFVISNFDFSKSDIKVEIYQVNKVNKTYLREPITAFSDNGGLFSSDDPVKINIYEDADFLYTYKLNGVESTLEAKGFVAGDKNITAIDSSDGNPTLATKIYLNEEKTSWFTISWLAGYEDNEGTGYLNRVVLFNGGSFLLDAPYNFELVQITRISK